MNLPEVLQRIEGRLKAVGISADKASKDAGKPDAIRNIRRAVKEKRRGVHTSTISALAPVLKTSMAWLMDGEGYESDVPHIDSSHVLSNDGEERETAGGGTRVVGYVGAGSEAIYYRLADDQYEHVPSPPGATDQTVAVEIRGTSLGKAFNTWLVFFRDVRSPITEDLFGRLCVVGLADDRILVKIIQRERDGSFTLISNDSIEPPIEDAEIEWAAKVTDLRPR